MDTLTIFLTQLILSVVVFAFLAKWFIGPWLAGKPLHFALLVLTFPHAMRHVGLSFLVPSLVDDSLGGTFAGLAAYGDFATGLLALVALVALRHRWEVAIPLAWLLNVVGTMDLINALRQADNVPHLHMTWYIPTFFVPLLLVTHLQMFLLLFQHAFGNSAGQIEPNLALSSARK
ncbi:MAG: hypothetical protein ACI87E_001301 [Mariniblastus sp.]|jgi:hypothetical protein